MQKTSFEYNEAFSRNTGWVTPEEQQILRYKRVAIAGLGGVGGNHLITLTRLGLGRFNISDFDNYDLANFNRQIGASINTINKPKLDVLQQQAEAINPEVQINGFPDGINNDNVDQFLENVDLYVDGLDFFAVKARQLLFNKCTEKQIPAITAAPLGMGCSFLAFIPGKMTFEEYFRLEGHKEEEQLIRFLVGLAPRALQNQYLIFPQAVDISNHKGPSTPMAIELCAGIAAAEGLKILLHRGNVNHAPRSLHFDAYRNKFIKSWRPGGNNNPLQKIGLMIGRRKFGETKTPYKEETPIFETTIEKILDLARWTPSGDNSQPWRFKINDDEHFLIEVDIDPANPYEYNNGEPTILSTGMLIETIAIAASQFNLELRYNTKLEVEKLFIECQLYSEPETLTDDLLPYIKTRSVDRRPFKHTPLNSKALNELESSLDSALTIKWQPSLSQRWHMSKLNAHATDIRLRLKSCYEIHKKIVDWEHLKSLSGVPAEALGLDKTTLRIMRWAMQKWERIHFLNTFLGGTLTARIQMDVVPGLNCAAHFAIISKDKNEASHIDLLTAGRCLQRFWLTATKLGLALQPGLAPLCFANRAKTPEVFNGNINVQNKALKLNTILKSLLGHSKEEILFLGRIGHPKKTQNKSRSLRLSLNKLTQ